MNEDKWRIWGQKKEYGETFFKRATGTLEEMECAKALCKVLSAFYEPGMKLVDVGCGVGHYLRSLKERLDQDIDYIGVDATENFIKLAKKAFPQIDFKIGDIFDLPFEDNSFDIVMNNNVIVHLPPPPKKAIEELMRISKKYVVIRTAFGNLNYIVKTVSNSNYGVESTGPCESEYDLVTDEANLKHFCYYNMYTEDYFRQVIKSIDSEAEVDIFADDMWEPFDNTENAVQSGTKTIGNQQISGNLVMDWRFIVIKKG